MSHEDPRWRPTEDQLNRWTEAKTIEAAMRVVRECWADLVEAEPTGGYFPLFDSKVVEQIIGRVLANVFEIRSGKKRQGNGASLLITGVKGVGKTTVMFGLCRVIRELEPKVTCAYHNYDGEKLSLVDVLRQETTLDIPPDTPFKDVLAKVGKSGGLVMFLDEMQSLYVPQSDPNYGHFINIVRDIQRLGKTGPHGFGVISGSTSNTRDRAYLHDRIAKAGCYPNLNDGVYREYILRPIRTFVELEQAVRSITGPADDIDEGDDKEAASSGTEGSEPADDIDEGDDKETASSGTEGSEPADDIDEDKETASSGTEDSDPGGDDSSSEGSTNPLDKRAMSIPRYFYHTGGVGRFLRSEVTGEQYNGDRTISFRRQMAKRVAFFALVAKLSLATPTPPFSDSEKAFNLPSISHAELQRIVKPRLRPTDNFREVVNKWVDKALLYRTENERYELLVPADIELYRKQTEQRGDDLFLNAALLGTLLGWGGHGSAGHVIEDFLRSRLLEEEHFESWEITSEIETLPTEDEYLSDADLAKIRPSDFKCRFFHQTKDSGLDGVFVCEDPDNETKVQLHALQIKTGSIAKKITTGGQDAKKPNDRTVTGIVAKAQLGFQRLFDTLLQGPLKKKMPSKTTFTLFTTKKVDEDAANYFRKGFTFTCGGNPKKVVRVACYLHPNTINLLPHDQQLLVSPVQP